MKKICYLLSILFLLLCLVGCERKPVVVTFQDVTMAGSDQNTVKVLFSSDEMYKNNFYDIWLKTDKNNIILNINFENKDNFSIELKEKDFWYSFAGLYYESIGKAGQEDFNGLKSPLNLTMVIESENQCNLTFKAISGDKIENANKTGFLLANTEDISKEYTQEITSLKK